MSATFAFEVASATLTPDCESDESLQATSTPRSPVAPSETFVSNIDVRLMAMVSSLGTSQPRWDALPPQCTEKAKCCHGKIRGDSSVEKRHCGQEAAPWIR